MDEIGRGEIFRYSFCNCEYRFKIRRIHFTTSTKRRTPSIVDNSSMLSILIKNKEKKNTLVACSTVSPLILLHIEIKICEYFFPSFGSSHNVLTKGIVFQRCICRCNRNYVRTQLIIENRSITVNWGYSNENVVLLNLRVLYSNVPGFEWKKM